MTAPSQPPIAALELPAKSGSSYPEPFGSRMGKASWRSLGDPFGLTQYGVSLDTLEPGAQSSLRHWHTLSDEFVYMLEGELVLRRDDGEFVMRAGMCVGFKAGDANAHHLVNRSNATARFLVIGTRAPGDDCFYPDDDLAWFSTERGERAVHKDGTPYPEKNAK